MQRRSVKEFSFGYRIPPGGERRASDGANELIELDVIEIGPTLKGANPATELRSVKALADPDDSPMDSWGYMSALVDRDRARASDPGTLEERLGRQEARTLRREYDRLRLWMTMEGIG